MTNQTQINPVSQPTIKDIMAEIPRRSNYANIVQERLAIRRITVSKSLIYRVACGDIRNQEVIRELASFSKEYRERRLETEQIMREAIGQ